MCGITFREMAITMITLICWMTVALAVQQVDLDPVKSSCLSQDSCKNGSDDDAVMNKICECYESCLENGTCCLKSTSLLHSLQYRGQECIREPFGSKSVLVVTKCSPSWNGSSDVKQLCENSSFGYEDNFLKSVRVTNLASGYIYSNYFCAVCNDDHQDAVFWNVTFSADEPAEFLGLCEGEADQELVYKTDYHTWGYWNHFSRGEAIFIPVTVMSSATDDMYDWIIEKSCQSHFVWECADGWEDESVREKCNAYFNPVREPWKHTEGVYQHRLFQNVHCAICNHVTRLDELICDTVGAHVEVSEFSPGGVSVTHFLGHMLFTKECRERNQRMYSPVKACRPFICPRRNC